MATLATDNQKNYKRSSSTPRSKSTILINKNVSPAIIKLKEEVEDKNVNTISDDILIELLQSVADDRKVLKQRDESLGNIFESMGQSDKKVLNVILKSDVAGTSEAIVAALADIGNDDASIKVVASGVGGISESDANLALAT